MLANELIDRLERLGLLDQEIIEALRQQLAEGGARVTPEAVAKLLVDNGQLTHFQASKLIGELRSGEYADESAQATPVDDLGFADDSGVGIEAADVVEVESVQEVVAVVPVESGVTVEPVIDVPGPQRPAPTRPKPDPQKSVWDSFKVYGYLGIIGMLLLVGGGIAWVLTREGADEVIQHANELYDQQSYDLAQKSLPGFRRGLPRFTTPF